MFSFFLLPSPFPSSSFPFPHALSLSLSSHPSLFLPLCVCAHPRVCACVCVCEIRAQPEVMFPRRYLPLLRQSPWPEAGCLGWVGCEPGGFTCLHLPSTWIMRESLCWLFPLHSGIELRPLCLQGKILLTANLPAPRFLPFASAPTS